ncbi:MAG: Bug family tripartite tricarboxylate transporter substrate binding protein [Gemmatimonas sp.]
MTNLMIRAGAIAVVASTIAGASATAQSVEQFYAGKTVTIGVGYPPGGTYDIYARVMANYIGDYIPGKPTIIVKNRPGAASLAFVNELFHVSPQDGTVFGTFARSVPMDRLLGRQGVNFVPTELNWIGSTNSEVSLCSVWHTVGIKSVEDFMSRPLVFGSNAAGSESDMYPTILNNLLGAHFKIVTGYPGANDLSLALERGEIQGRCGWTWSAAVATRPEWVRDKKFVVPVLFATHKPPELKDSALVTELARNDLERQALELILSNQTMGRPYAAPPHVPTARVTALRRAFDVVLKDPRFLAEAEKQQLEVSPVSGEQLQGIVAKMYQSPPNVVEVARKAIEHK